MSTNTSDLSALARQYIDKLESQLQDARDDAIRLRDQLERCVDELDERNKVLDSTADTLTRVSQERNRLRATLREIAHTGTSQPPASNMPEADWYRLIAFQLIRTAGRALEDDEPRQRTNAETLMSGRVDEPATTCPKCDGLGVTAGGHVVELEDDDTPAFCRPQAE